MSHAAIAERWRILSGENNWKDLLNPLDLDLRRYLIHYGERAQATYDAFNDDPKSVYAGSSKYTKNNLFAKVGLEKGNPYKYKVVKYFYATSKLHLPAAFLLDSLCPDSWCQKSNWIGYIAVATDKGKEVLGRRDILIAWRGTIHALEWAEDFNFPLTSAAEIFGKGEEEPRVHRGWLSMYTSVNSSSKFSKTSARDQILTEIEKLMVEYSKEEVSITIAGHSLGAALATLNAADIVANGYNKTKTKPEKHCQVTAFVYGCPKVGDKNFKNIFDTQKHVHVLRVRNSPDIVPTMPPTSAYKEVGEELEIDTRKSEYLNYRGDFPSRHNLEAAYLHGIAGTHGVEGEFKLVVKRDIALANKGTNFVKEKYLVPGEWWVQSNKGMVQNDDGSWDLEDHEYEHENEGDLNV